MSRNRKKGSIKTVGEEILPDAPFTEVEPTGGSPAEVHALYKQLSVEQQADLLRLILSDEDLPDISQVVQKVNTPGALDLLMDRICFYHFFPAVKEK